MSNHDLKDLGPLARCSQEDSLRTTPQESNLSTQRWLNESRPGSPHGTCQRGLSFGQQVIAMRHALEKATPASEEDVQRLDELQARL